MPQMQESQPAASSRRSQGRDNPAASCGCSAVFGPICTSCSDIEQSAKFDERQAHSTAALGPSTTSDVPGSSCCSTTANCTAHIEPRHPAIAGSYRSPHGSSHGSSNGTTASPWPAIPPGAADCPSDASTLPAASWASCWSSVRATTSSGALIQ